MKKQKAAPESATRLEQVSAYLARYLAVNDQPDSLHPVT